MTRPLHVLRAIAETTARLIVKAEVEKLPHSTDFPSEVIQLLAGTYIEARDQIRALHDLVDQTNPNDAVGAALSKVGLARRPSDPSPSLAGPRLVSPISDFATMDLPALYCRVMGCRDDFFTEQATFVVRQWDGMDGCWTDCTGDVGRDEALRYWAEKTDGGTRRVAYAEIDYYRIFPGGTRMLWDGSEGREMHR